MAKNRYASPSRPQRVAVNTVMLYIRMAFTMLVSLYTSRVIINALGVNDYGLYNVVAGFVVFFSFFIYTMQTATQRFLNTAMGKHDAAGMNNVYSVSVVVHLCIIVIVVVVGESVGFWLVNNFLKIPEGRMLAANWVYQISLLSTIFAVMTIPYNAVIIAHERMQVYAYISIIDVLLKLIICYLIVVSPFDKLVSYSFLLMCVTAITMLSYMIYCKIKFSECVFSKKIPISLFKEMICFAGWDLFGVIASLSLTQGTTIMINMFFSPAVNAAKAIAEQVKGAINGFANNFLLAMNPQITQSYASNDREYLSKLLIAGSKISFALLFCISLPICIKAPYILKLWLGIVPEYTVIFIRILFVDMILNAMMTPLNTAALATGKIRQYGFIPSVLSIVFLPVCYLLLLIGCKPDGVFWSLLILTLIKIIFWFYNLKKLISFEFTLFFYQVIRPCLIVTIISLIIFYFVSQHTSNSLLYLISFIFICFFSILLIEFFILLNYDERIIIIKKIKTLI